jgi:hypothetical protein
MKNKQTNKKIFFSKNKCKTNKQKKKKKNRGQVVCRRGQDIEEKKKK